MSSARPGPGGGIGRGAGPALDGVADWGVGATFIGVFAAFVAGQVALGIAGADVDTPISAATGPLWALAVSTLALQSVNAGVPLFVAFRLDRGREAIGLSMRALDVPLGAVVGVVAQLGLVPLLYLPFRHWIDSERLEAPARDLVDLASGAGNRVLLILMVVVAAPVAEELMYRGLLLHGLAARYGQAVAVVGSASVFGLIHFQLVQLPGLFAFGVVSAVLAVRTGRLGASMWAHAAFNAVTVIGLMT